MNILSLKLRIPSPRAWLAIAAFFISPLLWAGQFNLPTAPVPYITYGITWYGYYGYAPGTLVFLQIKAPGQTNWRTIASGSTSYYGSVNLSGSYAFEIDGVWSVRTTSGDNTTLLVSNSLNQAPVPTISVDGQSYGGTVTAGSSVTIRFRATDVNRNLSGIRYNIWNSGTGYFDNGGGGFTSVTGLSGEVTRTVALSTIGDWYFWTDVQDTLGAYSSTGAWGSGFKLTVIDGCSIPSFTPAFWNDGGTVQYNNNCYNYANNKRTDTFAQPGRGSGQMYDYQNITCPEVHAAAVRDGLTPTDAATPAPAGYMKIALVVDPYYDFHWYRKDCNGYWTHKPGGTQATNLDNSGNPITNPETANRGGYIDFCGYFLTPTGPAEGSGLAGIN